MTGPEHYREAERYLSILNLNRTSDAWLEAISTGEVGIAMQAAQVHATLALAAATALGMNSDLPLFDRYPWLAVAGSDPAYRERMPNRENQ